MMDLHTLTPILKLLHNISVEELKENFAAFQSGNITNCPIKHWKAENLRCEEVKNFRLKGIDIPYWLRSTSNIGSGTAPQKKIIVLGQEPFRTKLSFKAQTLDTYHDIELSTPFGIHLHNTSDQRVRKRLGLYWKIILFLATDHFVYLTDFSKLWFEGFQQHIHKLGTLNEINKDMWRSELEAIRPDYIITFGGAGQRLLEHKISFIHEKIQPGGYSYVNGNIRSSVIPLLHPSWTASRHRKQFFAINGVEKDTVEQQYIALLQKAIDI